jgi:hypothetical protein
MSAPYAGADSFPATIPVLDDADPPAASTWAPAYEGLADRTTYLKARTDQQYVAGDRIVQPVYMQPAYTADWAEQSVLTLPLGISQINVTGHLALLVPVSWIPKQGAVITGFGMIIHPVTGHSAYPIGTMPRIRLLRTDTAVTSAPTVVGDVTDATATQVAYEAPHQVNLTGLSETTSAFYAYHLVIIGEDGANAMTGMRLVQLFLDL